ncbi:hypothetical protein [Pseudomonas sp. LS-2]|uniref:hypothetical protein n=1 Tax=Pseudomonas sp. LS-2 TaxID=2315859 RepID=UPI000E72C1B5|nr:hypothetical protein D3M70_19330 [Pseudomonas sp. LS-2]
MGFLVTITSTLTGMRDRAAMVSCAYELQHFLNIATDVEISGVQMMCPPTLSRSGQWTLEDLIQITCFEGLYTDETAVVYRTSQDVYKIGELDLRKKKTSRVWFSKKRVENHRPRISESPPKPDPHRMYAPLYMKSESALK